MIDAPFCSHVGTNMPIDVLNAKELWIVIISNKGKNITEWS